MDVSEHAYGMVLTDDVLGAATDTNETDTATAIIATQDAREENGRAWCPSR